MSDSKKNIITHNIFKKFDNNNKLNDINIDIKTIPEMKKIRIGIKKILKLLMTINKNIYLDKTSNKISPIKTKIKNNLNLFIVGKTCNNLNCDHNKMLRLNKTCKECDKHLQNCSECIPSTINMLKKFHVMIKFIYTYYILCIEGGFLSKNGKITIKQIEKRLAGHNNILYYFLLTIPIRLCDVFFIHTQRSEQKHLIKLMEEVHFNCTKYILKTKIVHGLIDKKYLDTKKEKKYNVSQEIIDFKNNIKNKNCKISKYYVLMPSGYDLVLPGLVSNSNVITSTENAKNVIKEGIANDNDYNSNDYKKNLYEQSDLIIDTLKESIEESNINDMSELSNPLSLVGNDNIKIKKTIENLQNKFTKKLNTGKLKKKGMIDIAKTLLEEMTDDYRNKELTPNDPEFHIQTSINEILNGIKKKNKNINDPHAKRLLNIIDKNFSKNKHKK
jgi:hypothetical protein